MSYPIPRGHFLYVHDALRKVFGRDNVELSAFVKNKRPFQCEMLINAPMTDPDVLRGDADKLNDIVRQLQGELGSCTLRAQQQRINIVFRDQSLIHLALGAPKSWLGGLKETSDINQEPDWRKRNRLRISLGFDENLFTASCSFGVNLASRALEKYTYDYYRRSPLLSVLPGNLRERFDADYRAITPPVTYWQAHCYALSQAYPIRHFEELETTVWKNFASYYQRYPFDNPYCAGEDLNTMQCAQLLCSIWQQTSISTAEDVMEAAMETRRVEEDGSLHPAEGPDADGCATPPPRGMPHRA